jgi:hypothetical protein
MRFPTLAGQDRINHFERQMNTGLRAVSEAFGHSPLIQGEGSMLARRFTIVCLLMSLFGMFFAILVAEASHPARPWDRANSCQFGCVNHFGR